MLELSWMCCYFAATLNPASHPPKHNQVTTYKMQHACNTLEHFWTAGGKLNTHTNSHSATSSPTQSSSRNNIFQTDLLAASQLFYFCLYTKHKDQFSNRGKKKHVHAHIYANTNRWISLLPKRPPSRHTEADSWTILVVSSRQLHSALNTVQCVCTNTHTQQPLKLFSVCVQLDTHGSPGFRSSLLWLAAFTDLSLLWLPAVHSLEINEGETVKEPWMEYGKQAKQMERSTDHSGNDWWMERCFPTCFTSFCYPYKIISTQNIPMKCLKLWFLWANKWCFKRSERSSFEIIQ